MAVALALVLVAMASRVILSAIHRGVLLTDESPLLYQAATLSFSYLDFGFVRRGLAGSIVALLGPNRLIATALFHVMAASAVAVAVVKLLVRVPASAPAKVVYALLAAALMARFGEDPGRTDLCVAALLAATAIAVAKERFVLAFAVVAVCLCVQETGLIFGAPLLLGLLLAHRRRKPWPRRALVVGGSVLALAIAIYLLLPVLPHADRSTMVATVRAALPAREDVDWAIYFAVSGQRGVAMSVCQNLGDSLYGLPILSGLAVMGL